MEGNSLEDWKKYGIDDWTEGAEPWFYFLKDWVN
jgi:kynureninase